MKGVTPCQMPRRKKSPFRRISRRVGEIKDFISHAQTKIVIVTCLTVVSLIYLLTTTLNKLAY